MLASLQELIGRRALAIASHGDDSLHCRRRSSNGLRRMSVLLASSAGTSGISSTTPLSTCGVEALSGAISRHPVRIEEGDRNISDGCLRRGYRWQAHLRSALSLSQKQLAFSSS